MRRQLFDDEHEPFRDSFRRFLEKEVVPHHDQWERDGIVPREVFAAAGANGFVGMAVPEEYGGGGVDDFRFNVVIGEETARVGATGFGLGLALHNDICLPYFLHVHDRRAEGALAAGHRLRRAHHRGGHDRAGDRLRPGGDARPPPAGTATTTWSTARRRSSPTGSTPTSSSPRSRPIPRSGTGASACWSSSGACRASSGAATSTRSACTPRTRPSCSSPTCASPSANLLGEEGQGFAYLVTKLPQERLSIAVAARGGRPRRARPGRSSTSSSATRSASRSARSRTRSSASPRWRRRSRSPRTSSTVRACPRRRRAHRRGRRHGQVVVHRAAGPGRSTGACSCTAATAT